MALRFIDSFDHYSTVTAPAGKWTASSHAILAGGAGRFGTNCIQVDEMGAPQDFFSLTLDNQATWIVGFAFSVSRLDWTGNAKLVAFVDDVSNQCEVWIKPTTGKLFVARNGTVLSADSAVSIAANIMYHIEFKATIGNAGSYELRVNEVTQLVDATEDTQNTANASANRVMFFGQGSNSSPFLQANVDDVYICDGTGGVNDDFLGDCRVQCLFPNGNGATSNFDGSDGNSVDNYLLVDETTPDGDTTYVQSADIGDKDTYAFTNLTPLVGDVFGVQTVPYARKSDAGSRTLVSVARLSATEEDSASSIVLDTYTYMPKIFEEKPGGGVWTITDVNAAEFGVKVNS